MEIRKIRNSKGSFLNCDSMETLKAEIETTLKAMGFNCSVSIINKGAMRLSSVTLDKSKWNLNLSPYTSRRGATLNFKQWELINHVLNVILDNCRISATIESLNGVFKIRKGATVTTSYTDREYDNIGSIIRPCYRVDAWRPEDEINFNHAMNQAVKQVQNKYPVPDYFKNFMEEV